MALSFEEIVVKFPYNSFAVKNVKLDYQSTHNMQTLLYGNSFTLVRTLVGVNHGCIGLFMWDTIYATILPAPYVAPVNLRLISPVPLQATTAQLFQLREKC